MTARPALRLVVDNTRPRQARAMRWAPVKLFGFWIIGWVLVEEQSDA